MGNFKWVLYSEIALTWILVGVVFYMQLIHYPLFKKIREGFAQFEHAHIRRTACFMGPLMLLDGVGAAILVGLADSESVMRLCVINLILVGFIWLSTLMLTVALHQKLSIRFSKNAHKHLLNSNWIRCILWFIKGVLLFSLL